MVLVRVRVYVCMCVCIRVFTCINLCWCRQTGNNMARSVISFSFFLPQKKIVAPWLGNRNGATTTAVVRNKRDSRRSILVRRWFRGPRTSKRKSRSRDVRDRWDYYLSFSFLFPIFFVSLSLSLQTARIAVIHDSAFERALVCLTRRAFLVEAK